MEQPDQSQNSQKDQPQPSETPPQPQQPEPTPEPQPIQPETPQQPENPTQQEPQPQQPPSPAPSPPQPEPPQFTPPQQPAQPPEQPQSTHKSRRNRYLAVAAIAIIACSLFAGIFGFYIGNMYSSNQGTISSLQRQVADLQNQVAGLSGNSGTSTQLVPDNVSLSTLYDNVKDSVVVITDTQSGTPVEGSGFIDDLNGRMVIVTNNHVIASGTGISVTFSNGDGYAATVLGADSYADLAVLSASAPANEFHPLQIVNSSSLSVGDFVAAVGSPFGLSGSMTTGIVSALGRSITESTDAYAIADVIQFSAPINPGNLGGPLLNSAGEVVGINTAGIENGNSGGTAQGVGFAISSQTILREISSLVETGSYTQYSYMGVTVVDNSYDIATQAGLKVTYGLLVESVKSGGPADKAGLEAGTQSITVDGNSITTGGDVITAINGVRIINEDQLSTFLAENTLPGQTISVTVQRGDQTTTLSLVLGSRQAAS